MNYKQTVTAGTNLVFRGRELGYPVTVLPLQGKDKGDFSNCSWRL